MNGSLSQNLTIEENKKDRQHKEGTDFNSHSKAHEANGPPGPRLFFEKQPVRNKWEKNNKCVVMESHRGEDAPGNWGDEDHSQNGMKFRKTKISADAIKNEKA